MWDSPLDSASASVLEPVPKWSHAAHVQRERAWQPLWSAVLSALAFSVAWQALCAGSLLAADAIALSEPWRFVDESKPGAPAITGELAATATDAPAPVAARFRLDSTMQALALQLHDDELRALPVAQIDELRYCTRLVEGLRPYAVTLQVNIDADVTDEDESWQGRLVYTPSHNGAVIQGEWQCWNTLAGKWWATGGPLAEYADVDSPQLLGTLLARFPNLGIHDTYSGVALKAGDGWSHFSGEASPVVIGVEGERIEIAFGTDPDKEPQENQVLLPILFNESQVPPQNDVSEGGNRNKNKDKQEEKDEDNRRGDEWSDIHWGDWGNFDWANIDWGEWDWESIDWEAVGWPDARAETLRAFIEDVKQCKGDGWEEMGFKRPGLCVAYYVEAHAP